MQTSSVFQSARLTAWLPALITGAAAGAAFLWLGSTPPVRALGLAAAIVGMTLALQRFGALLAVIGGLALAFSPAFWSQTGGSAQASLALIPAALVVAAGVAAVFFGVLKRPDFGLAVGLVVFVALFWLLVGTPRSLRLTTIFIAWLLALLVDMLMIAHARPDDPAPGAVRPLHTFGLLLLLALGVFNDPLFVLIAPAVIVGLLLAKIRMARWFWIVLAVVVVIGVRGTIMQYIHPYYWLFSADAAGAVGLRVPYLLADAWREGERWIVLINLVVGQFTAVGAGLGILGLARLSRWYPPLGGVLLLAYGVYAVFGLMYFGGDAAVLLLPLLMIQVYWMTYAVFTFSQWMQKSVQPSQAALRWLAPAAFTLLPLFMLLQIIGAA